MTANKFAVTLLGMWRLYRPMREIVARARQIARAQGSAVVSEAHLFIAILDLTNNPESTISALLAASGASREEARIYAQSAFENRSAKHGNQPRLTRGATLALAAALQEADRDGNLTLEARHLLIACARPRETNVLLAPIGRAHALHLGDVLLPLGLDSTRLREHLRGLKQSQKPYRNGNPLNDLSPKAKTVIEAAHGAARASFCGVIAPVHLLLGLLNDTKFAEVFQNAGCDLDELKKRARDSVTTDGKTATMQKRFSPAARRVLERAARDTKRKKRSFISCEDLRRALLESEQFQLSGARDGEVSKELWTPAQLQFLHEAHAGECEEVESVSREEFSSSEAVRFRLFLSVALNVIAGLNGYLVISLLGGGGRLSKKELLSVLARITIPPLMSVTASVIVEGPLSYGAWCVVRVFGGIAAGAGAGWLWSHFF